MENPDDSQRPPPASGLPGVLQRHEWAAFGLLLAAGLLARIVWVSQGGRLGPLICETYNAAVCFARSGGICDTYFPGQGPTATAGPVLTAFIGLIYRAFGEGSRTSEMVLTAYSLGVLSMTVLAFYLVFRRLRAPVEWRLAAVALAMLVPINFKWETISMRLFEGGVSALFLAVSLWLVLRLDARPDPLRPRDFVLPAILVGLLALINPPTALGAYGAFGVLVLKRVPWRGWLGVALVMALGLLVFIAPWGLRNAQVFHRPILARSTFPLEHALGFHPAAVSPADPSAVFVARGKAIHPYTNDAVSPARDEFKRLGEIAYMDKLRAETGAWERDHPADTVRLAARHLSEFWLPPAWSWTMFGRATPMVLPSLVFVWGTTLAAFAAVAWRLVKAPLGPGLYLASVLIVPSLTYALVQPVQRYRYLIVVLTYFLAADFVAQAAAYAASLSRRPAPPRRTA